ncbi:MAG: flippase-like domain-containing protein, partial [Caldilineaceae bacterium]|nr:flippase-like domain-containing protein [Caldilineaceae bacterium]
ENTSSTTMRNQSLLIRMFQKLTFKRSIALLISFTIFGYLLYHAFQGIIEFQSIDLSVNPRLLTISVLFYLVGVLLAAKIWNSILRHLHGASSYWFDIQVFGISLLARKIPGFFWEALSRFALYERKQVKRSVLLVAIITELVLRSLAGGIAFAAAIFLDRNDIIWLQPYFRFSEPVLRLLFPVVLLVLIVLFLILLTYFYGWFVQYLQIRQGETKVKSGKPLQIIQFQHSLSWTGGYVALLLLSGSFLYFFVNAFEGIPPISFWTVFGGFGLAVALGPLSMWLPGDIGLRDGILYLALRPFLTDATAAVLVLVIRFWSTFVEIVFGGICALLFSRTATQWFPFPVKAGNTD